MSKKVKTARLPDDAIIDQIENEPKSRQSRLMEAITVPDANVHPIGIGGARAKTTMKKDDFPDSTFFDEGKNPFMNKEEATRRAREEREKLKKELDERDVVIRGEFSHNFEAIKKMMEDQLLRNQELNRAMIENHLQKGQEMNMAMLKQSFDSLSFQFNHQNAQITDHLRNQEDRINNIDQAKPRGSGYSPMSWKDETSNQEKSKANTFMTALKAFPQERKFRGETSNDWMLFKNFMIQHCTEYNLSPNDSLNLAKACIVTDKCDYVLLQIDINNIAHSNYVETIKNEALLFYLNQIEYLILGKM